jgi:hypothetical protein
MVNKLKKVYENWDQFDITRIYTIGDYTILAVVNRSNGNHRSIQCDGYDIINYDPARKNAVCKPIPSEVIDAMRKIAHRRGCGSFKEFCLTFLNNSYRRYPDPYC